MVLLDPGSDRAWIRFLAQNSVLLVFGSELSSMTFGVGIVIAAMVGLIFSDRLRQLFRRPVDWPTTYPGIKCQIRQTPSGRWYLVNASHPESAWSGWNWVPHTNGKGGLVPRGDRVDRAYGAIVTEFATREEAEQYALRVRMEVVQ